MKSIFEREEKTFESHKQDLLKKGEGKFVIIKGEEIISLVDSFADAVQLGKKKFGKALYYIKQVIEQEPVMHFHSFFIF